MFYLDRSILDVGPAVPNMKGCLLICHALVGI